jgi:hypothetical protein
MAYETLTFRPSKENSKLLAQLAELAKQDNRKLNNYIETLFIAHLKERGQKNNKTAKRNVKSKD